MKTRQIQAPDIQSALREVRRVLGADAVIMSTRETATGIEIIAGATPAPVAPAAVVEAAPARVQRGALSSLAAGLARSGPERSRPATQLASASDELLAMGLSADLRARVDEALRGEPRNLSPEQHWDAAQGALAARLPVEGNSLLKRGGRVALVGGSGVGKTTTLVKLAAHFARLHGASSVALVNTDTLRVGASEQLRRYARLMGLAVCNVRSPSDLTRAFDRLSSRRLVLVDTAGTSYQDLRLMDELERLQASDTTLSCYLALSCNTQLASIERTARAFDGLRLRGCVLTKADEAVSLGSALSFVARRELPVSFVTTGPNVPADIRVAHPQWLVQRAGELLEESRHLDAAPVGRDALNRR